MKNKIYYIIGILILVFGFFYLVSGLGYDWPQYGSNQTTSPQTQYNGTFSYFNGTIISTSTTYSGMDIFDTAFPYQFSQPIVNDFGSDTANYVAVTSGVYLRAFDKNLALYAEINTSMSSLGQLGTIDWDLDGNEDIAGFWRENSTYLHFKVYNLTHINVTNGTFNEIYDYGFSYNATNYATGVKCDENNCYTLLLDGYPSFYLTSFQANSTDVVSHLLYVGQKTQPLEPPSFMDIDEDGEQEFIAFSPDLATIYDSNGTVIRDWSESSIRGAKFVNASEGGIILALIEEVGSNTVVTVKGKNITSGAEIFSTVCLANSGASKPNVNGFAIKDYDGDGYDDIWCAASREYAPLAEVLHVYNGTGSSLYGSNSLDIISTALGGTYYRTSLLLGRMDNDSSYDAAIFVKGSLGVWSTLYETMMYNTGISTIGADGTCVLADLTYDGFVDYVCADSNSIEVLSTNVSNGNPSIDSVSFSPSTIVGTNVTLTATITATDTEGNTIYYRYRCNDSDAWSTEDFNNTKECNYSAEGSYNLTVGVRDQYHTDYINSTQLITVSDACDFDLVCEPGQNETYANCASDCDSLSISISYPLNNGYYDAEINLPIVTSVENNIGNATCYFNLTSTGTFNSYNNAITDCSTASIFIDEDAFYTLDVWTTDSIGTTDTDSVTIEMEKSSGTGGGGGGGDTSTPIDYGDTDGGGGGGGGEEEVTVIIGDNITGWTFTTDRGRDNYILIMNPGEVRTKPLKFQNIGEEQRHIKIECIENTPDFCDYVTFTDTDFVLPVLKNIDTLIEFTVTLPEEFDSGDYIFNIRAYDDLNRDVILTVTVKVGTSGFLIDAGAKFFTSYSIGNVKVPYFLTFLFLWPIIGIIFYFTIFKNKGIKGGKVWAFFGGLFLSLILTLMI